VKRHHAHTQRCRWSEERKAGVAMVVTAFLVLAMVLAIGLSVPPPQ